MMTNLQGIEFGVVRFMPIESFDNPMRGLGQDARVDKLLENLPGARRTESVRDWPRIRYEPILRDGVFIIETAAPDFTAMLRFCPDKPNDGAYEIHYRPRGKSERGRITNVIAVPADGTDAHVSMLMPFASRYAVHTAGSERPHSCRMWLVGLKTFRIIDGLDQADG